MKRFVVAINNASTEQRNAIAKYLHEQEFGYWHWFQDFWLVTTIDSKIGSTYIRDVIQTVASGVHCLVLEVEGNSEKWAGFGDKDRFDWLHKSWNKD
ncbi:MAG: hypothetical protein ABW168_00275 [Sedimenticola sp.]